MKTERTISVHDAQSSLAFSPDGRTLQFGGDKAIFVINVLTGAIERRLAGHAQPTVGVAFAGRDTLISASRDRTLRIWDWPGGLPLLTLDTGTRQPGSLAVSQDGRYAACMVDRGGIVVWDLAYYHRHVAANAAWNLGRLEERMPAQAEQSLIDDLRRAVPAMGNTQPP